MREKQPYGFILENVEGLVTHDKKNPDDKIGRTLSTILYKLENELHYQVNWKVLDAQKFGLAQSRNRIYIVGTKKDKISLSNFKTSKAVFGDIMEHGLQTVDSNFARQLFKKYTPESVQDLIEN